MITSVNNQKIKDTVRLRDSAKARREEGVFLVEGPRMFAETPPELIVRAFISESCEAAGEVCVPDGIDCETVTDTVYRKLSDTVSLQGVMAVVRRTEVTLEELADGRPVLILEGIQDPGNLGTMMRTAEAAGAAGIIADRATVDLYNPKVVRATMGTVFRVPYLVCGSLADAAHALQDRGYSIYAAHLEGSCPYTEPDYTAPCAFLIGNEGNGLTAGTAALADRYIRIPMEGRVESLNAAMAAGILMYEAHRQRHFQ